jgi:uncharacterized protein (DUF1330 family)
MTAYWVNTFTEIRDEEQLQRYAALAGPAMTAAGGRFLARGNPVHVFEDGRPLRTTLIEFPSPEAARRAYESPAYQEALAVLGDAATREIRIVDGV